MSMVDATKEPRTGQAARMIKVRALGGTQVLDDNDDVVRLRSRKHVGLLLYLLSNSNKVHTRSKLCGLFWTTDQDRARHSLSQGIYDITQAIGPIIHRACGHDISVKTSDLYYDVTAFESAVRADKTTTAVELYTGSFARNLTQAGTTEFELWLDSERTRLARLNEAVLRRAIMESEARGQWGSMCLASFKLAQLAPFDMSVHSSYMRALWHQGDATAALNHYERVKSQMTSDCSPEGASELESLASKIRAKPTSPRRTSTEELHPINWEPPLVGREVEFKMLRRIVSSIDEDSPPRVIVKGGAGIGKSRLVNELCESLSLGSMKILRSRCHQAEEDLPYSPIVDAVRSLATDLLRYKPTIRGQFTRLPFLVPELRVDSQVEEGERADPEVWRRALYEEVVSMFSLVTRRTPLVWVVDDVQWVDRASGALLHYLCRRLERQPFMLLVTAREEGNTGELVASPLLESESKNHAVRELCLGPLPEQCIRDIVANAAPESWEHPARSLAVRLSSGNPYYALEVLAAAVDSREWAKSASAWDPLNDSRLRKVLEARLRGLGTERVRLLQAVAVLDRFARPRTISQVLGVSLNHVAELAEALYGRSLIQDESSRVAFVNDTMREFVYSEMTTLQRASLHLKAGRTLEGEPEATAGTLAIHFQHGDDWLRSFGYAMEAARAAQDSAGHAEAAHFASVAVDVAPGRDEQRAALEIRADSSFAAGDLAQAAICYESLLRLPNPDPKAKAGIQLQLANVEVCRCRWLAAAQTLSRARESISAVQDDDVKISLLATHSELALKLAFLSDDPEAARESEGPINRLVERIREVAGVSKATAFSVLSTKAIQEAVTGSSERALAAIEEAEDHLSGTTQYERMRYFGFRGYVRSRLAKWDAAEVDLLRSLEAATTTGDLLTRIRLWNNLACLSTERGHWSSSTDRIEEAAQLQATLIGRSDTSLSIVLNRANLYFYQGLLRKAVELYQRAGELCEADGILGTRVEVHSCLGLVALQRSKMDEARHEWNRVQELRNREGVLGGTQERFKYAWFSDWMSGTTDSLREAAAEEKERDVPSYAKLKWLIALLGESDSARRDEAREFLHRLEMAWFARFSERWVRHAALTRSA